MAETKETLREFCANQVQRLSLFRRFDFLEAAGRKEIRNWLESKGERRDAIAAVLDAAVLLEELPTLAELTRIWIDQQPAPVVAKGSCQFCAGAGFEIVKRGEFEGAKRCRCGGVPVADPNQTWESRAKAEVGI